MPTERPGHVTMRLKDGRVLLCGGAKRYRWDLPEEPVEGADIYDPATDRWQSGASPQPANVSMDLALLGDGSVLLVGDGIDQRYDPSTDRWTAAPGRPFGGFAPVVSLADGSALTVARGIGGAAVFLPGTGTWKTVAGPSSPPSDPRLVVLASGEVMVLGGSGTPEAVEIFDPAAEAWRSTGSFPGRSGGAVLLGDGRVLATPGAAGSAAMWSPATGSWTPVPPPLGTNPTVGTHALVAVGGAAVALVHGDAFAEIGTPPVQWFEPGDGWTYMNATLWRYSTLTHLADGRILVTGERDAAVLVP
jgi:hypothetical protein